MRDQAKLDFLLSRRSHKPKRLGDPAPSPADLAEAARAALRAPDHGGLRPYRFVLVREEARQLLGQAMADDARRGGATEEEAAKAASKARKGPQMLAFVFSPGADPEASRDEQLLCAGAALEQFLLALRALGYGAIVLSGSTVRGASVRALFERAPGEELLAWITCGAADLSEDAPESGSGPLSVWPED